MMTEINITLKDAFVERYLLLIILIYSSKQCVCFYVIKFIIARILHKFTENDVCRKKMTNVLNNEMSFQHVSIYHFIPWKIATNNNFFYIIYIYSF